MSELTLTKPSTLVDHDFESAYFIPAVYNRTYYSSVMQDEAMLIRWKAGPLTTYLRKKLDHLELDKFPSMFDAGSGPAIHHLLTFVNFAKTIHLSDYLEDNLAEIRKWVDKDQQAHDWKPFVTAVLTTEGLESTPEAGLVRARQVRKKIASYSSIDLKKPLHKGLPHSHLLVTSFFVADSATSSKNVFTAMTKRAFSIVAPGGVFVAAYLGGCSRYRVGRKWIASASITEEDIELAFKKSHAKKVKIWRFETPEMAHDGFTHIFAVVAEK